MTSEISNTTVYRTGTDTTNQPLIHQLNFGFLSVICMSELVTGNHF